MAENNEILLHPSRRHKPKTDDYKANVEYYRIKLSYKLPVTLRYGTLFGLIVGTVLGLKRRSFRPLASHTLFWGSTIGFGLSYEELYGYISNYMKGMN